MSGNIKRINLRALRQKNKFAHCFCYVMPTCEDIDLAKSVDPDATKRGVLSESTLFATPGSFWSTVILIENMQLLIFPLKSSWRNSHCILNIT